MNESIITVKATIAVPQKLAWWLYNHPRHITQWNFASDEWCCPNAENELKEGGKFNYRMEAKDGSIGFDFRGKFDKLDQPNQLFTTIGDGRKVVTTFEANGAETIVTTVFEAETTNSVELQQQGWQAILDNFKKYAEAYATLETAHFSVEINAPAEKVFEKMLYRPGYNQWTEIFSPGSDYEGNWEKGSSINFIVVGPDGKKEGMVSRILDHVPNRHVVIEHLGVLVNGEPITDGPESMGWAGAKEIYTLHNAKDGATNVEIAVDVSQPYKAYFDKYWPAALQKLKEISEE